MARYVTEAIAETECIGDSLTKINTNFEDLDTVFKTLSTNITTLSAEGASVTTSSTAPSNPSDGDLWFDEDTGTLYVRYVDSNSAQWVEIGGGGGGGGGGTIDLTTDATGILPIANGGTNRSTGFAGLTSLAGSTLPVANTYLKVNSTNNGLTYDAIALNSTDVSGILPIANGGTNRSTGFAGLTSLAGSVNPIANTYLKVNSTNNGLTYDAIALNSTDVSGILPAANGGAGGITGLLKATAGVVSQAVAGTDYLTSASGGNITLATPQTPSSVTSANFTDIPSYVKRITITFSEVSTNGVSEIQVQLGTGVTPTYVVTGYKSSCAATVTGSSYVQQSTTGFVVTANTGGTSVQNGIVSIVKVTGNRWAMSSVLAHGEMARTNHAGGSVLLAGALTAVRITSINGTDTFDAGTINISYEG